MSPQDNWRWCNQCQGLFFAGNATFGVCPARGGGPHNDIGSGNYTLTQGSGSGQPNWRWCYRCQGLFFGGNATFGVCPAGGTHAENGSGNYFLTQGSGSGQSGWRWCYRCQGLFFGGNATFGVCPAGGTHAENGSGNYFLPQQVTPAQIALTVGAGEFSFTGTGFVPQTMVQVTSLFEYAYGERPGGPWVYSVDSTGSFTGLVPVNYFEIAGTLYVGAVDSSSGQSASTTARVP